MSSALAAASLILKPEGYSEGTLESLKPVDRSGDFTFTRGSNLSATRVNSAGLIEKGRENLLLQSNQFDATWTTSNTTITSGQSGYDGSNDAWKVAISVSYGAFLTQNISGSGVYTFSGYFRKGDSNEGLRFNFDASSDTNVYVDLTDGSSTFNGTLIQRSVTDVGNGFYRVTVTANLTNLTRIRLFITNGSTTQVAGNIYIQDAQLEVGMVATDYIETGASTVKAGILENTPRLDYSGGATEPSLLLEPSRTNLISQSEYFTALNSGSVVVNDSLSPEGLQNANKIIFGASVNDGATMNLSASCSGNTQYTWSAYVKNISGTGVFNLRIDTDTTIILVNQDITATSEWTRVSHTFTTDASATSFGSNSRYRSEADGNEILIWGAQLEQGSYPTSYIPTYGSSETRSKDTGSLDMITAGITTGLTSATLFIEYEKPYTGEGVDTFRMHGTSTNGRAYIYNTGVGFSSDWAIAGGHTIGETTKHIWRLDSLSEGTRFRNGAIENAGSGTAWSDIRYMYLNNQGLGGILKIKQILLFPTALSDADCITLTTL